MTHLSLKKNAQFFQNVNEKANYMETILHILANGEPTVKAFIVKYPSRMHLVCFYSSPQKYLRAYMMHPTLHEANLNLYSRSLNASTAVIYSTLI